MLARITPAPLAGTVPAIASKSMAHRIIIAAALANGVTQVACNTTCADIDATVRCLTALGARIERTAEGFVIHPMPKSMEHGLLRALAGATLDCGESGSTLRFMLPVACALGADAVLTGAGRLGERPLAPLSDELIAAGSDLEGLGGFPLRTRGRIRPGRFELPGNVSSQYVSGLLLAAPLLGAESEIAVTGALESKPYVDLTIEVLSLFGVKVAIEESATPGGLPLTVFRVPAQSYRTPGAVAVEGDWSNAAFWLATGAISGQVTVSGLDLQSRQGDRAILAALAKLGSLVSRSGDSATVTSGSPCGCEIDASDFPDLVPPLAAVAALAPGTTRLTGCGRLRLKESDRIETVCGGLSALGADIASEGDDIVIHGRPELEGGVVDAAGDHRIAMMAAVAAARCRSSVTIRGAECVEKSYPAFFDDYQSLGGVVGPHEG